MSDLDAPITEIDLEELLFFDTFSHEVNEDINLDLVQFPKPVYITEVRIIPLGARVQADFPGGVRLGATNPSKFGIEFFVNDLGKPGASTFECLGNLEYNQNNCIHLECTEEKIPTDGLVLRGWYTTITLAVYGTLTKHVAGQIASPPPTPNELTIIESGNIIAEQNIVLTESDVVPARIDDEIIHPPILLPTEIPNPYNLNPSGSIGCLNYQEASGCDEICNDSTTRPNYNDDNFYNQSSSQDGNNSSSRGEHEKRTTRKKSRSSEERSSLSSRNRTYSSSNDRDFNAKKREWSRSPEYRQHSSSRRIRTEQQRSRKDSESHLSNDHKRPRSPPTQIDSPPPPLPLHRPQSPDDNNYNNENNDEIYRRSKTNGKIQRDRILSEGIKSVNDNQQHDEQQQQQNIDSAAIQLIDDDAMSEQFEPILSDDEILGDDDVNNINNNTQDDINNDDLDIEMEELMFENAPKLYDPFKMPLNVYNVNFKEICQKDICIIRNIFGKILVQTQTNSINEYLIANIDEKENFVNLCENLVNQLNHVSHFPIKKRNFILAALFKEQSDNLQLASNILKIALDFECATSQPQPGYKIRHIKLGPRLAELFSYSIDVLQKCIKIDKIDLFQSLFDLYLQNHMALSIKLIILRAIYGILDTKIGVEMFLNNKITNGYQQLLIILQNQPLTRAKYALKAIMNKLNLYEAMENVRKIVTKYFIATTATCNNNNTNNDEINNDFSELEICLNQIIDAFSIQSSLCYQQPKRFLPVTNKFEIINDTSAQQSWSNMYQSYLKEHLLFESILLIIINQNFIPLNLLNITLELLTILIRSNIGLNYLIDNSIETAQILVDCLLDKDEQIIQENSDVKVETEHKDITNGHAVQEIQEIQIIPDCLSAMQKLGIEIAYKIQIIYHIIAINNNRDNIDIICEHLNSLHGQNMKIPNRFYLIEILGYNGNLTPILNLIEKERKLQTKRLLDSPGTKYKSPILSLSIDLLDSFVRNSINLEYLITHGQILLDLVKNHDIFDSSVSAILQEMSIYLKPLELVQNTNFEYNDVTALFEIIKRSIEYITTFPGDLIMGLRILKYLTIGNDNNLSTTQQQHQQNYLTNELKYRYIMLQFYSADGILILLNILEKLNGYFEQPGLHGPTLMTIQGIQTCQIIQPTLEILKDMLTFAILCRSTQFKDVTAIEHLMKCYFLMHYYPEKSPAYEIAQKNQLLIIKILLAYTQPNEVEEELVHKSLWTQMIREVIKNILSGPSTFLPGLKIFCELIPLPLPIQVLKSINDIEKQRLVTERKLWSAHLHPECFILNELIQTICTTSYKQLSNLLIKICWKLSDLAPNMTLLVSKTIIDLIVIEYGQNCINTGCTGHLVRLLNFFTKLTSYASIKISALSIFSGKPTEYFNQILLNNNKTDVHHIQCQINIHKILRNFFNTKISLNNPKRCNNLELNLACSLPSKELIPDIINAICGNLLNSDNKLTIIEEALKNLIILTEHDITFYYLRQNLLTKFEEYGKFLQKIINFNKTDETFIKNCQYIIKFYRALLNCEESLGNLPQRTLKITLTELANILTWKNNIDSEENTSKIHPLSQIKLYLLEYSTKTTGNVVDYQEIIQDYTNLIEELENLKNLPETADEILLTEPNLSQAEGIVTQYLSRPIFTVCPNINDNLLEFLYWQELDDKMDSSVPERISCNLTEIVSSCMPPETNLQADCKRILHLSVSPQSNRERTTTAPCFRTRRVEVEPQTGRPEKKIFVSPMRGRGFQRAPPSRSDLFRSRPPNTSRPPSLHVDDFLALETCGAQPTGPTGYNKLSRDIIGIRGTRGRGRGSRISNVAGGLYRKANIFRTNSPSTWNHIDGNVQHPPPPPPQHFRTATSEPVVMPPHFSNESHYTQSHFVAGPAIRSRGRGRGRILR